MWREHCHKNDDALWSDDSSFMDTSVVKKDKKGKMLVLTQRELGNSIENSYSLLSFSMMHLHLHSQKNTVDPEKVQLLMVRNIGSS